MTAVESTEEARDHERRRATAKALAGVAGEVRGRRTFQERGFPFQSHPNGWFQIGWSEEFPVGEPRSMTYFSSPLVGYRGESGRVTVMDAHCAHMGAHLGHGGQVEGDDIVCPFHSWRWNPAGENTDIPYSAGCSRRTMRTWPVAETTGAVFVWHHAEGIPPTWKLPDPLIPEADDPDYHQPFPYATRAGVLAAPPQWVVENTVDLAHIASVHHQPIPTGFEMEVVDPATPHLLRLDFDAAFETPKGRVSIEAKNIAYGLGMLTNHSDGLLPTSQMLSTTPIDHTQSQIRFSIFVRRQPKDGRLDPPTGLSKAVAEAQLAEIFSQDRDFPIWENMAYLTRAAFTKKEAGPFRDFRRWATQFYAS